MRLFNQIYIQLAVFTESADLAANDQGSTINQNPSLVEILSTIIE